MSLKEAVIALLDEIIVMVAALIVILYILYNYNIIGLTEIAAAIVITVAAAVFLAVKILKVYEKRSIVGPEALIGKKGTVLEDLSPIGKVLIDGEIWNARAVKSEIKKGEKIVVRRVEGLTLIVEAEKQWQNVDVRE